MVATPERSLPRNPVFNDNSLKLGVFFANVGGGARPTLAEGRLQPTWPAVLEVAALADRGGIEAIIPLATWSVRNNQSDFTRYSFEPWAWAAGLAQATEHIAVFTTAQVPIFPPVVAAKLTATVDHIADGRFAINVVCGHAGQALDGLLGAPQLDHDEWYAYADEWIEILERLWRADTDVFDYSGRFFQLKGAGSYPKPLQQPRPAIMNAGTSEVGQRWAARHSDIMFTSAHEQGDEAVKARVNQVRALAHEYGREVSVWMSSSIVCRPTEREAWDYLDYCAIEKADMPALTSLWREPNLVERLKGVSESERKAELRRLVAGSFWMQVLVGTPEQLADRMLQLSRAGIDGLNMTFVNYEDELVRIIRDVLPLLEQAGLRRPFAPRAGSGNRPQMATGVRLMDEFVSRRSTFRLLALGLGGIMVAACSPATPSSPAPSTSVPAAPTPGNAAAASVTSVAAPQPTGAVPKAGGTIRTGQVGDIANLDGHYANQLSATTVQLAYEKLVAYDTKLQPQPVLAESWDIGADSKTFKFNLRKGVQFHSGREFTSDDVKYNFLRVRQPSVMPLAGTLAPQSTWFSGVDTPDKYTVVLTADQPRPGIFDFLSAFNMVDKDTMEGPNAKTAINGTGPFKFVEWASGDHITLARNPSYWQSGRPYLAGIQVSIVRDAQSMVTQLEAGALDAVYAPPLNDTVRLMQNPAYLALVNPQLGQFFYVNQNVTLPLFQDKRLRQAMNYALNRQRISQTVLQNLCGDPICLPWPQQSPAYESEKNSTYTFDLDKAAALLKQAGISDASLEISYSTSGYAQEFASMAQIYQADLQSLGIQVTLKPVDGPTFTQSGQQHTYQGLRIGTGAGAGNFEASTMLQSTSAFNYAGNFAGFKDDRYGQLVLSATTEPDAAKRKQIYSQLNDYLLDQSFTFAFSWSPATAVVSSNVHALDFSGSAALSYANAWLQ